MCNIFIILGTSGSLLAPIEEVQKSSEASDEDLDLSIPEIDIRTDDLSKLGDISLSSDDEISELKCDQQMSISEILTKDHKGKKSCRIRS